MPRADVAFYIETAHSPFPRRHRRSAIPRPDIPKEEEAVSVLGAGIATDALFAGVPIDVFEF